MRVYVAGPITAKLHSKHPFIESLGNIKRGIIAAKDLLIAGHQPFCPFLDFQFFLHLDDTELEEISDKHIKAYSMAWLEVCDVMIMLKGWGSSEGTLAEMRRARELGIPIYHGVNGFLNRKG